MHPKELATELSYVDNNFEFSEGCSFELRNYILGKGYASYYDDVLMLTPMGESLAGYVDEDKRENPEEDLTEGFHYMNHYGDEYE